MAILILHRIRSITNKRSKCLISHSINSTYYGDIQTFHCICKGTFNTDMSFKRYTYLHITKVRKIIRWSYSGMEVQCPKSSESLCKYLVLNMKLIKPWRDLCNMKLFPLATSPGNLFSLYSKDSSLPSTVQKR